MVNQEIQYKSTGNEAIIGKSARLKCYPGMKISQSGTFKSIGSIDSRLYYGIVCYRADGTEIIGAHNLRKAEHANVVSVEVEDYRTILELSDKVPPTWHGNDSIGYFRSLGFYLDGNIDHAADFVHYFCDYGTTVDSGAYQIDKIDISHENRIILNKPLSEEDLNRVREHLNQVVVMNHLSGGYHYGAAASVTVPRDWTTFSATYQGESFNDAPGKLRMGTDSIEFVILANYQQDKEAVLKFKDLHLSGTIHTHIEL